MKVGDRVVVKEDPYGGESGTVTEVGGNGPFCLTVRLDGHAYDRLFASEEVEKLEGNV